MVGLPVEVSVNVTVKGFDPLLLSTVNEAFGPAPLPLTVM